MKRYFVTASFKNDELGQFVTQFDFYSDEVDYSAIHCALISLFESTGIDIMDDDETSKFELVHFSIYTF